MSLIMHHISPDRQRAELVSDTCHWDREGPIGFSDKVAILPHCLSLLAHRGISQFLTVLKIMISQRYTGVGLDGLLEVLIPCARAAQAATELRYDPSESTIDSLHNELHVIGYSKIRGGFCAVRLMSGSNFEPEWREPGAHCSGVNRELPRRDNPLSIGEYIRCAVGLKEQCGADTWISGDLILHELSAAGNGSIRVAKIYRFKDFDDVRERIEARWTRLPQSLDSSQSYTALVGC